jgi:SPP1 gp7 family putative phage head morphogenesis protein
MQTLQPVPLKDSYWVSVKKTIDNIFYDLIYRRLRDGLKIEVERQNQPHSAVVSAIRKGDIYYNQGRFKGKFNSTTSKEIKEMGGVFSRSQKAWVVPKENLDADILSALAVRDQRDQELNDRALQILTAINLDEIGVNPFEKEIEKIMTDFDRRLKQTFKKGKKEKKIPTVGFVLTEDQKEIIARDWGENLTLYVKKFSDEEILSLREQVLQNTSQGLRAENLEKIIMQSYGVSQRKAKFLARQETSLLVSKYRETNYTSLGLTRYVWLTSKDERVRESHRKLNNKIFFFGEPPVINSNGDRRGPGEDYGCRCVAKAIVD